MDPWEGGWGERVEIRRPPPHPFGRNAQFFPYSATTSRTKSHDSGLQLRVVLPTPPDNIPFRSGELIRGTLTIARPGGRPDPTPISLSSLTLQAYFESRTLFWNFGRVQPKTDLEKAKKKFVPNALNTELEIAHEVHRGLIPRENLELSWEDGRRMNIHLDELGPDGVTPEVSFPFTLRLPVRITVSEWNHFPTAPRDLCSVERCPPPSFPNSPNASIEWIVEAVFRLDNGPQSDKIIVNERLFKQPSPSTVVTRVVFPLLPADSHAQDHSLTKYFGRDLTVDEFGSSVSWEGKANAMRQLRGKGGEWKTYKKIVRLNAGNIMSAEATLVAELSLPKPAIFQRSASTIPLVLSLTLQTPTAKGLLAKKSLKELTVTKATISIKRQLGTRGGKHILPDLEEDTVRSEALDPLRSAASSAAAGTGLLVKANVDPVVWDIDYQLQTESMFDDGRPITKRNTRVSTLSPSFRTPNVQLEYLLIVTISIEGRGDYFIATFPIQLLAGDSAELPSFAEATGQTEGQDDSVALPMYSVSQSDETFT